MSSVDDLSPTGMGEPQNEISNEFNNEKDEKIKGKTVEVSDEIKNHHPVPEMRPPWDTSPVDRHHVEQRLDKEGNKDTLDPFEKAKAKSLDVRNQFNTRSDEISDHTTREILNHERPRDAFNKVAEDNSISRHFNDRSKGIER